MRFISCAHILFLACGFYWVFVEAARKMCIVAPHGLKAGLPVLSSACGGDMPSVDDYDNSGEEESNYEPSPTPGDMGRKEKMVSNMPYDEALELSQVR